MTLKSRLRVTQGHWKRNHWIDYTRLTISRFIWRWILLMKKLNAAILNFKKFQFLVTWLQHLLYVPNFIKSGRFFTDIWRFNDFQNGGCKGVRCPPIFSLSNLINVGWLVRKCVDIYVHPLIAGTNRKAFCCMLVLRWRTVTASDHQLLILLWSNNWCLNIYILMNCHNGHRLKAILTNEDKERLVTWPCWDSDDTVELVETTIRW